MKKLERSIEGKVFLGVFSGMGEYFDTDPVLLRVFYIIFTFFTGIFPGTLAYLVAALAMPLKKYGNR
jgi:phage shock protein PspC (stress-responsive transcriptional regulator)